MPLSETMLDYYGLDTWEHISVKLYSKCNSFHTGNEFESVVCKMAAILSRPQWDKGKVATAKLKKKAQENKNFVYNS